jgi:tetratricopeptide (TPR) repeat protein
MMEDHRDAYFLWQEMGLRGASCLHIDAHLDMAAIQVPLDASLSRADINCGNYLLKAIQEGIIGRLIWVVPPHLMVHDSDLLHWLHAELQNWLALTLEEFNSLQFSDGRVTGQLRGVPVVVCTSHRLPDLEGPWLLDLDIDYYLDAQDHIWQTPFELKAILPQRDWQAITIAYSVVGGYTPVARRYLGDLSELLWTGKVQEAEQWWASFHSLDSLEGVSPSLQAAALVARAWGAGSDHQGEPWQRAASLDPAYRVDPADVAAMYWLRKRFSCCTRWLLRSQGPGSEYLHGFMALEQGRPAHAARCWDRLLTAGGDQLDANSRRHLLGLLGKAWKLAKKPELAREALQQAMKIVGGDPHTRIDLYRELGRVQREMGQLEAAIVSLRKGIQLGPDRLDNLEAQVELAELYIESGQLLRAQGEYRKLAPLNLPGNLRMRTERLPVKIALRHKIPRS